MADEAELPKGMFTFAQLEISKPQRKQLMIILLTLATIGIFSLISIISLGITTWIIPIIMITLLLISFLLIPNQLAIIRTPLAVNMNHPFVDDQPLGNAEVFIRLSNGNWIEPGLNRLRVVRDDLLGGWNLVEDNEGYSSLGHFSNSRNNKIPRLQVIIINQALSLRDVINNEEDPIEDARERESQESGLLDREWMDQEELDISGPISKLIGRNE
jgi:hypothetical protein